MDGRTSALGATAVALIVATSVHWCHGFEAQGRKKSSNRQKAMKVASPMKAKAMKAVSPPWSAEAKAKARKAAGKSTTAVVAQPRTADLAGRKALHAGLHFARDRTHELCVDHAPDERSRRQLPECLLHRPLDPRHPHSSDDEAWIGE
jgi:hypothetical protein